MGFRSYIRQFLGAILMLFLPSLPGGFAAGSGSVFGVAACYRIRSRSSSSSRRKQEEKAAKIHLFLWVSEVTLGSFWAQFWYFSVLHCQGDLLLGVVRFLASQLATGSGAGVAAAAGGNRKKKQLKSAFSIGFRSYIRQFLGAILMLFRPSLPGGFAAGSGSVFGVAACYRIRSRSSSSRRKKQLKSSFSMGFRSYIRQFLGAILMLFRPSLPRGFAAGRKYT